MAPHHSLKFALLLFCSFVALNLHYIPVYALNVGLQYSDPSVSRVNGNCSNTCESEFCTVAPFLRYGKYCGLLYTGCPEEKPCDGLDTCCMKHDDCVGIRGYLSQECSQNFLNCMADVRKSGGPTFPGNKCDVNQTIDILTVVIQAALVAGGVIQAP